VPVPTSASTVGAPGARAGPFVARAIRGTLVERRGLTFDTKYAAAASGKPEPVGHLFALLEGSLQLDDGTLCKPPFALMLADDEWERRGKHSRTFRTWGAKFDVVQLRFARDQLRVPIGIAHGAVTLSPACWDATRDLLARGPGGDATVLSAMLDTLASSGVIAPSVPKTVIEQEPERFRRLWDALRPLYQTHGATTSLKQLASSLGMSMRQVGRDAKELSTAFGIGGGYRDALLVLRLRTAVLMLSAPEAGVAGVAKLVAYGSPVATARPFRRAVRPGPGAIPAPAPPKAGHTGVAR